MTKVSPLKGGLDFRRPHAKMFGVRGEDTMANAMQNRRSSIALALGRASIMLVLAAILAFGAITSQPAQAQSFLSLYSFAGGATGGLPYAPLVQDS